MTNAELWRRIQNMVTIADIHETKASDGKMLAKVKYGEESTSDWLPVSGKSSGLVKMWSPPSAGEQVVIFRPNGEADGGVIMGSIANKNSKEPTGGSGDNVVMEMSDGTRLEYDAGSKTLNVKAETINFDCATLKLNGEIITDKKITDEKGNLTDRT